MVGELKRPVRLSPGPDGTKGSMIPKRTLGTNGYPGVCRGDYLGWVGEEYRCLKSPNLLSPPRDV